MVSFSSVLSQSIELLLTGCFMFFAPCSVKKGCEWAFQFCIYVRRDRIIFRVKCLHSKKEPEPIKQTRGISITRYSIPGRRFPIGPRRSYGWERLLWTGVCENSRRQQPCKHWEQRVPPTSSDAWCEYNLKLLTYICMIVWIVLLPHDCLGDVDLIH